MPLREPALAGRADIALAAAPAAPAPPLAPGDPVAHDGDDGRLTLWRRRKRRVPPPRPRGVPLATFEPHGVLGIADFLELRREGLFGDDGRTPPPSWWAR